MRWQAYRETDVNNVECLFCKQEAVGFFLPDFGSGGTGVNCKYCGEYGMTEECLIFNQRPDTFDLAKIACYVKEHSLRGLPRPILYSSQKFVRPASPPGSVGWDAAIEAFPKTIAEKLDRALLNLNALTKHLGDYVNVVDHAQSMVSALNTSEMDFLLNILQEEDLVEATAVSAPFSGYSVQISAKGFNRIAELQRGGPLSKQVFVAMKFDPSLDDIYEIGIKAAIEKDCGYDAFRVDRLQHNEDINDKIIAEMKKSKFMVADFTGHRNGVYFEAGFMMGLGRTVIFACKESEIGDAHFDTSHRNHVLWTDAADYREKLKLRIQATITP